MDNRWEIANYKALTWIKCTLQLVVMEPLNDLLNSLKSPSLCKAILLSWADIKRKTWFFYKLKNKAARMQRWQTENKKMAKKKKSICSCLCACKCMFAGLWAYVCVRVPVRRYAVCFDAPLTFICAVYPKAICPAATEFRQMGTVV